MLNFIQYLKPAPLPKADRKPEQVAVLGHQLAYTYHNREKSGPVIIFLHGMSGSVRFWRTLVPRGIKKDHPYVLLSLPMHSPCTFPDNLTCEDLSSEYLHQLLDGALQQIISDQSYILVGYSFGGFWAFNHAAHLPPRLKAVVGISTFANGMHPEMTPRLCMLSEGSWMERLGFQVSRLLIKTHPFFLDWITKQQLQNKRTIERFDYYATLYNIYEDVCKHDISGLQILCEAAASINLLKQLREVQVPTLSMITKKDITVPYACQLELSNQLPNNNKIIFEQSGHVPFSDQPAKFEKMLNYWLKTQLKNDANTSSFLQIA